MRNRETVTSCYTIYCKRHLIDGLVDREAGDLARGVFLEFDVSELDTLDCLVWRHLGIDRLYLILKVFLKIGYAFVLKKVGIREDLCHYRDPVFLYTAFTCIDNNFIYALNLLKISLDFLRIDVLAV